MATAKFMADSLDAEYEGTRRTLERIPEDQPQWKPHEKSMPMGRLAKHVAQLPVFGLFVLNEPSLDLAQPGRPMPSLEFKGREDLLTTLESTWGELRKRVGTLRDEELAEKWRFSFGSKVISDNSREISYQSFFFGHLIHHRAQLGVYLRLLGVAVPSVYGPSSDEPFVP